MRLIYYRPLLTGIPEQAEWRNRFAFLDGDILPPLANALISLLNGVNTLEEIYGNLLVQGYPLESVHSALHWLDEHKLLTEAPGSAATLLSQEDLNYYHRQTAALSLLARPGRAGKAQEDNHSGVIGQSRLKESVVTMIGLGDVGLAFARALVMSGVGRTIAAQDGGVKSTPSQSDLQAEYHHLNPNVQFTLVTQPEEIPNALGEVSPNLMVYCPDNFNSSFAEWINKVCLEFSIPLLLYRRNPLEIDIGPLIIPRETACYVCCELRLKAAKTSSELFVPEVDIDSPRLNFPLGADLLALEAIKFLSRAAEPVTYGRIWRMNLLSGSLESHSVLKLPRCPACGSHKVLPSRKLWEEMK